MSRGWHVLLIGVLCLGWSAPEPIRVEAMTVGNCRFGITAVHSVAGYDLSALGVSAFLDWGQRPPDAAPPGLEYVHVVRLRNAARQYVYDPAMPETQSVFESELRAAVAQYPGAAWLVGNEPDTAFETQDALTADQYAVAYRNAYRLIKSVDPTARVGIGTIVQPTPLRMMWLDLVWQAYRSRYKTAPPADFWSIHSFILREQAGDWGTGIPPGMEGATGELITLEQTDDLDLFAARLINFRRWLAEHGERNKPLWITEYGSLIPHDASGGHVTQPIDRAREYMIATFDLLREARDPEIGYPSDGGRLVQRWFWYSLNDDLWRFGGSLFDPETGRRTILGDAFAEYVTAVPLQPDLNLLKSSGAAIRVWPRNRGGNITATVIVSNSGTAATTTPLQITWFEGDPRIGGQPLAVPTVVNAPLPGCGSTVTASASFQPPADPRSELYVQLDSPDISQALVISLGRWKVRAMP
jgi:hypothetical protein